MNFSELLKQSSGLCKFSHDGRYLANASQYKLIVRDVKTLQILNLFTCLDNIQHIEWSSDSLFILCGLFKRGLIQIWSLEEPEWTCKIDEGSAGVIAALWSPDGRHILTTAEFHLRITVWSLVNKSVSYIKYAKGCPSGIDFSRDGRYMALAERRDCHDCVSIFDCDAWQLVKHFETCTDDMAGLKWSPQDETLCIWENCVRYGIALYSIAGQHLGSYSAYNQALGIKVVTWSPSGQLCALGSFDQKVRILNSVTWKPVMECEHPAALVPRESLVIYKETSTTCTLAQSEADPLAPSSSTVCKYEIIAAPMQLHVTKPNPKKANPKVGVGMLAFSSNGRFFYTRNDCMPGVLWLWDVTQLALIAVLIQAAPIKCVEWDPTQARLALCTGTKKVYMWSAAGSLAVEVPADGDFAVQSLSWLPDGSGFLLCGADEMCICYLQD